MLSLEPGTQGVMETACPQTWQSASKMGMRGVLGELWCGGVKVDWSVLRAGSIVPSIALPMPPMRYRRCWYEPNSVSESFESAKHDLVYVEQWERLQQLSDLSLPETRQSFCLLGVQQQSLFDLSDALSSRGHVVTLEQGVTDHLPKHLVWCLGDESCDKNDPAFAWQLCERVKKWSAHGVSRVSVTLVGTGFVDHSGRVHQGLGELRHWRVYRLSIRNCQALLSMCWIRRATDLAQYPKLVILQWR